MYVLKTSRATETAVKTYDTIVQWIVFSLTRQGDAITSQIKTVINVEHIQQH